MKNINWALIRARLMEAVLVLPHFFKNPIQGMRAMPAWDWPTIVILQGTFAAACAILTNIVARNLLGVITAVVVGPLTQILLVSIAAGFFYYLFMLYFKREIPYRQVYLTVVFAAIPAAIVNIVSPVLPPATLVGAAASLSLLYVGFVDNFFMDRVRIRNILGALMAAYLMFWAVQMVGRNTRQERHREKATPESLDILEKELNLDQ